MGDRSSEGTPEAVRAHSPRGETRAVRSVSEPTSKPIIGRKGEPMQLPDIDDRAEAGE
jgi:hypothetical protein